MLRGDPALLTEGEDTSSCERHLARLIRDERFLGMRGRDGKAYSCFSIGHQLLLAPCIALGEQLARTWPEPEHELARTRPALFNEFFWSRLLISFVSPDRKSVV